MSGKSVSFINNHTPLLGYRISIISIRYLTIRFDLIDKVKMSIYRFVGYWWHPSYLNFLLFPSGSLDSKGNVPGQLCRWKSFHCWGLVSYKKTGQWQVIVKTPGQFHLFPLGGRHVKDAAAFLLNDFLNKTCPGAYPEFTGSLHPVVARSASWGYPCVCFAASVQPQFKPLTIGLTHMKMAW